MSFTAAQRKAAERARHKETGRVAVTVYIWPEDREHLTRYIKRLNERRQRARDANVELIGLARTHGKSGPAPG